MNSENTSEKLKANISDPDSRIIKTCRGNMQAYNAQAAASEEQIIPGTEITRKCNDKKQLMPMLEVTKENLGAVDMNLEIDTFLANAGYFEFESSALRQHKGK